ncbi:MAG: hypothetical protein WA769_27360 [Pseudolabrys sp.]
MHPDQSDQCPAAAFADRADDAVRPYAAVGLVVGVQAELDARPQDVAPPRILGESVETGECIGGDGRADPLDRVAVVVIVRRLDHHEVEHIRRGAAHDTPHAATTVAAYLQTSIPGMAAQ